MGGERFTFEQARET